MLDCGMHMGFNGKLLNRQHALGFFFELMENQLYCHPVPFKRINQLYTFFML